MPLSERDMLRYSTSYFFLRLAKVPSTLERLQNIILRYWKNSKEIMINNEGTKMAKDR